MKSYPLIYRDYIGIIINQYQDPYIETTSISWNVSDGGSFVARSRWEMKIWRKSQGLESPVADGWFSVCCLLCKKIRRNTRTKTYQRYVQDLCIVHTWRFTSCDENQLEWWKTGMFFHLGHKFPQRFTVQVSEGNYPASSNHHENESVWKMFISFSGGVFKMLVFGGKFSGSNLNERMLSNQTSNGS